MFTPPLQSGIPIVPLYHLPDQPLRDLGEERRHVNARARRCLFCASEWGDRVDESEGCVQVVCACAEGGRAGACVGRGRGMTCWG